MSTTDTEQSQWFAQEVKPHESALRAYLCSRFSLLQEVDDVVQETYIRLVRARTAGRIRHVRALMFRCARNVALDYFRRRRGAPAGITPPENLADIIDDQPDAAESLSHHQELEVLAEAVRALPERCRQVMMFRHLNGLSCKEVAGLLDISTETVKTQVAKGVLRCAQYFAARGVGRELARVPRNVRLQSRPATAKSRRVELRVGQRQCA